MCSPPEVSRHPAPRPGRGGSSPNLTGWPLTFVGECCCWCGDLAASSHLLLRRLPVPHLMIREPGVSAPAAITRDRSVVANVGVVGALRPRAGCVDVPCAADDAAGNCPPRADGNQLPRAALSVLLTVKECRRAEVVEPLTADLKCFTSGKAT